MRRPLWIATVAVICCTVAVILWPRADSQEIASPGSSMTVHEGRVEVESRGGTDSLEKDDSTVVSPEGAQKLPRPNTTETPQPAGASVAPDTATPAVECVHGWVRNTSGAPIADAEVGLQEIALFTDIHGMFRIEPTAAAPWILSCSASGYASLQRTVQATTPHDRPLELVLKRERLVLGRTADAKGRALKEVSVRVGTSARGTLPQTRELRTDSDGTFTFSLREGQQFSLRAEKEDWIPTTAHGDFSSPNPLLVLHDLGIARGRVLDENEQPVEFAEVTVHSVSRAIPGAYAATLRADQKGTFATERVLTSGVYKAEARQNEYYDVGEGEIEFEAQSPAKEIQLRLVSELFTVIGFVVELGTERRLEGMAVQLSRWSWGYTYGRDIQKAVTNEEGRFVFQDVPPGQYVLTGIDAEEPTAPHTFPQGTFTDVGLPGNDPNRQIRLYAVRKPMVEGKVVERDGTPVAGAQVENHASGRVNQTETDSDGRFHLSLYPEDAVDAARYRLVASAGRYPNERRALSPWFDLAPGESLDDLTIVLDDGVTVRGRVLTERDSGTQPVVNASVTLKESYTWHERKTHTDAMGVYEIKNALRAIEGPSPLYAPYILSVEAEGFASVTHMLTPSPEADPVEHDVMLRSRLAIRGRVTDSEGRPLEDVHIYANRRGLPGKSATTDGDGRYTFETLEEGLYDLLFQYSGRTRLSGRLFRIPAGSDSADIQLGYSPVNLSVRFTIEGDLDPATPLNAVVGKMLEGEAGRLEERNLLWTTLGNGSLSVMLWEPGVYQLRCYVPLCPAVIEWLEVGADSPETIVRDLTIGPQTGRNNIFGWVRPVPGYVCRYVVSPVDQNTNVPVQPNGYFSLRNVPDGPVFLSFWLFDEVTGIPRRADVFLEISVRDSRGIPGKWSDGGVTGIGTLDLSRHLD